MMKEPYDNEFMLFLYYHDGHVCSVGVIRFKERECSANTRFLIEVVPVDCYRVSCSF